MNFELSEEQIMVRNMVRDFAEKEIVPVARDNSRNEHFPADLVQKMAEMGLNGLNIPGEYGGGDADYVSYCVMLEELARADHSVAVILSAHISLACKSILGWGSEEQKKKYLPRLTSGALGCFGTTEPNVGSDVSAIETTATKKGNEWVLNGSKMWITNGGVAEVAVIIAQTDKSLGGKGLTAFLVDRDTPGFSSKDLHNKMGVRASNTAELVFEDCVIPGENMLGPVGKGMSVALSAFDSARLGVASRCVGSAQACIDASVSYAQTRKQFGKLIGNYQLVQEMIANMTVETEAARLLVYRAATMKDNGNPATIETSMAKFFASEIAFKAANDAIQIHGSYGYCDDYPVERHLRDVRVCTILEGTSQVHRLIIGRHMTGINAFT
ncbi:MAG: acyl-CoA dehydrogenase family protein [Chloroflexota bacterium]